LVKRAVAADGITTEVIGRPTGYGGSENERRWKDAVRVALSGQVVSANPRVFIELDFRLAPDQLGRNEPDLDNLIKSTIDALEGVLGERQRTGVRVEADDVRVERILASKRHTAPDETPGARIIVRPI
jgi:Holliday junction resolvase RusA-like endonuclease